jgi:hypothetical protein
MIDSTSSTIQKDIDPFRGEDLIYEKVQWEEYGIKTKLDVYPEPPL